MSSKINFLLIGIVCVAIIGAGASRAIASDEAEVRGTIQRIFQQLKSHDYSGLYDSLPASSKSRITRERFMNALQRAQGLYQLDRMEIGTIRVAKEIAIADTVLYGRVAKPFEAEGKIVAQQYLVRENGRWRVATGDPATTRRFLSHNPEFAKRFPIKQPRVYVKQNGKWVEFRPPRG